MNRLKVIYDITLQLKEVVDQEITSQNREQVIEKVNQLVEQRGEHMQALQPPYSKEEKLLGKSLIPLNEAIEKEMQVLFNELKKEMKQVKKQKKSNRTYTNPYEHVQTRDGMFMDSKK